MFRHWKPLSTKRLWLVITCCMTFLCTPVCAQNFVAASNGPIAREYPFGSVIPEGEFVTLSRGETMTIISDNEVHRYIGAGRYRIGNPPDLAGRTRPSERRGQPRRSVIRHPPLDDYSDAHLFDDIPITQSERYCLVENANFRLRRSSNFREGIVLIDPDAGESFDVSFETESRTASLPVDFFSRSRSEILITWPKQSVPIEIEFIEIDSLPETATLAAQAIHLADNGCRRQINRLVATAEPNPLR